MQERPTRGHKTVRPLPVGDEAAVGAVIPVAVQLEGNEEPRPSHIEASEEVPSRINRTEPRDRRLDAGLHKQPDDVGLGGAVDVEGPIRNAAEALDSVRVPPVLGEEPPEL